MFKCPDCYCGLKSGAPTKMGGTCTMGMSQGGRECTRPDGCCNPRKHPNGPNCLTVDPSSAGLAFKMDYCTAQGELPYKWVAMKRNVQGSRAGYGQQCDLRRQGQDGPGLQVHGCHVWHRGLTLQLLGVCHDAGTLRAGVHGLRELPGCFQH